MLIVLFIGLIDFYDFLHIFFVTHQLDHIVHLNDIFVFFDLFILDWEAPHFVLYKIDLIE